MGVDLIDLMKIDLVHTPFVHISTGIVTLVPKNLTF